MALSEACRFVHLSSSPEANVSVRPADDGTKLKRRKGPQRRISGFNFAWIQNGGETRKRRKCSVAVKVEAFPSRGGFCRVCQKFQIFSPRRASAVAFLLKDGFQRISLTLSS